MSKPIPLLPGNYYHIYNRGTNRENIFIEEKNYLYFLKLYAKYIPHLADTYAYCLVKNHFHFLVRIKTSSEASDLTGFQNLSGLKKSSIKPHQPFSNLFNAYTKSINKAYGRTGSLFERPFKRIEVSSDTHLLHLIAYIHQNPQKHGFVDDFRDWPYTSYATLLDKKTTYIKRGDVLAWFEGEKEFTNFHQTQINQPQIDALMPEDFE